jgi:uncharacterized membrane protein YjfL (UPF0719 family)
MILAATMATIDSISAFAKVIQASVSISVKVQECFLWEIKNICCDLASYSLSVVELLHHSKDIKSTVSSGVPFPML